MSTNVYILDFGNRIKIGRTKNIEQRIRTLENAVGEKAGQVFYLETDGIKEKLLHHYLQEHRTIGEYFTCSFDTAKTALENIVNEPINADRQIKPSRKRRRIEKGANEIIKCNDLIRNAEHNLSAQEQKVLSYFISKLNPNDNEFKTYEFNIREFCEVCGIDKSNGKNYSSLRETITGLRNKGFYIADSCKNWIEEPVMRPQDGTIEIQLDKDIKPFLLQLREKFTQYELIYTLPMRSQYSIRIYELLKSYENMHKKNFDINELKRKLMCENKSYENFSNFRKYVIDIAISEINEFTDVFVDYTASKTGRKVTHIEFLITSKRDSAEKIKTLTKIEALLDSPNERNGV